MNTIAILVSADDHRDALSIARSTMEDIISKVGYYYEDQPVAIASANTDAFWLILNEHYAHSLKQTRNHLRNARTASTYASKIYHKANAYRALDGRLVYGASFINVFEGDDPSTKLLLTERDTIRAHPNDYYIIVFNINN